MIIKLFEEGLGLEFIGSGLLILVGLYIIYFGFVANKRKLQTEYSIKISAK